MSLRFPTPVASKAAKSAPSRRAATPAGQAKAQQLAFDDAWRRDTGEPTGHVVRIVSIMVEFLRASTVNVAWYQRRFELSERQFGRDMQHLRKIGEGLGFRIGRKRGGCVALEALSGRNDLADVTHAREQALRAIAFALGTPAQRELETVGASDGSNGGEPEDRRERFLLFAFPRLLEGTTAAAVYEALKRAHTRSARVRFRYHAPGQKACTRMVEPYRVLNHAGRYYLIAFDIARRGWRYFALDKIEDVPSRAGTFTPRTIPPAYLACDALGMLQRGADTIDVTVRLSPVIAASVISRSWQSAQRVRYRDDGSADITLTVNDPDEVVRWSLGFGAEAQIVAPQRAVQAAVRAVTELTFRYGQLAGESPRAAIAS